MIELDISLHDVAVTVGKQTRHPTLAPKEYEILKMLADAQGKVLSRQALLEKVWGHGRNMDMDTRTVDQHVARLRKKLGNIGLASIATVTNYGYRASGVTIIGAEPPTMFRVLAVVRGKDSKGKAWTEARVRFAEPMGIRKGDNLVLGGAK